MTGLRHLLTPPNRPTATNARQRALRVNEARALACVALPLACPLFGSSCCSDCSFTAVFFAVVRTIAQHHGPPPPTTAHHRPTTAPHSARRPRPRKVCPDMMACRAAVDAAAPLDMQVVHVAEHVAGDR